MISLRYGKFLAIERQGYCPIHPDVLPARPAELDRIVAPGAVLAYDVLVRVGLARWVECRQFAEIQADLARRLGIVVPTRTLGHLAHKFVAYVQSVHRESVRLLRRDMTKRGGYILHVDGTCEEGSQVLLVCLDSLSAQVLESRKVGSESTAEVRRVLAAVRRHWGVPLAVVHDLRNALITAAREVFPGVPQFVCHYHLAADVGKDIFGTSVDRLRRLVRRTKLRPKLGALCRALRPFAVPEGLGTHVVARVLDGSSRQDLRDRVTPESAKGTVHALASWILAALRTDGGYGFPFDLPYLRLYERVLDVHKILDAPRVRWPKKCRGALGVLRRFKDILAPVAIGEYREDFRHLAAQMRRDLKVFERFRAALRICPRGGRHRRNDEGASSALSPQTHRDMLAKVRTSLRRKARRDAAAARACTIVVDHLDKYWDLLFGHAIRKGRRTLLVPRTNNCEEGLFRVIKRQCRRLHGRGHLARDVDAMAAGTALVLNLRHEAYRATVYGGHDEQAIAQRFSQVDPRTVASLMKTWRRERLAARIPRSFESLKDLPQRLATFIALASDQLQRAD